MAHVVEYRHIQADKQTGRLMYRRVYPPKLRAFISGHPTELKRSLAGTDLSNPTTMARYDDAAQSWLRTVEEAERRAQGLETFTADTALRSDYSTPARHADTPSLSDQEAGHGHPLARETLAPPIRGAVCTPTPGHVPSFESIAFGLLDSPAHNVGASTRQASTTALRFFREAFGPLPPSQITKALVTEWIALLFGRPSKLPASQRSTPLRDLVRAYEGDKDTPRLSAKTVTSLLGMLCSLWNKAQQEEGVIDENLANPFAARKSLSGHRADDPIELSVDELNAIFRLPIFTIGERPRRGKGEAAYWIPLLLLWTGARPEEIAQLMVADVHKDPDDPEGRWLLRITDEGVHPHKGRRGLKTTKSQSGRRTFPIPKPLLELSFMAYVDHIRASGETALFPALRTKGASKLLFPGWGEWWSKYLQDKGVLPANAKRRAAREFRHVWTTAARRCKVPEDAREYIQGHRSGGKSANVLYGSLSPLGARIDEIRFDGLDLSHVKPWRPNG